MEVLPFRLFLFSPFRLSSLLPDGTLASSIDYMRSIKNEWLFDKKSTLETRTQYAGMNAHMAVIQFLRHLSKKYFKRFELTDESQYWETGDEELCRKQFEIFTTWMSQMISKLDKLDGRIGEIGEAGELIQERILALCAEMHIDEILEHLETPPPPFN